MGSQDSNTALVQIEHAKFVFEFHVARPPRLKVHERAFSNQRSRLVEVGFSVHEFKRPKTLLCTRQRR